MGKQERKKEEDSLENILDYIKNIDLVKDSWVDEADALGEFDDERAIVPLKKALKHKDYDTRIAAAGSLGRMNISEGIKVLITEKKNSRRGRDAFLVSGSDYSDPHNFAQPSWEEFNKYKWAEKALDEIPVEKVGELLEELKLYDDAEEWYTTKGMLEKAGEMKQKKADLNAPKISQKIVHGDEVTKTEIRDSVLNRSNIGGGSSKMQELKDLTEMKKEGLIDDDEFKQMKKEILGK